MLGIRRSLLRVSFVKPQRNASFTAKGCSAKRSPIQQAKRLVVGVTGCCALSFFLNTADCANGGANSGSPSKPSSGGPSDLITNVINQFSAQINMLGISGVVGICAGMAIKRATDVIFGNL
jgi:hypothetical protein